MADLGWLSQEMHKIHDWFQATFYVLVTVFLLLGVVLEYFKMPLGNTPSFGTLIGRALIAAILLHTFPEIANTINDLAAALSKQLGDLTQFRLALDKMGDKLGQLSWSWTSARQSAIVILSYLCFFLLYFSVHVAQALYLYSSVLLFVFSPILIALFVLPQTAAATSGLFRSLIEVSLWKPVWCVIATLIWSSGISDIQGTTSHVSFLSAVCFCLIAAGSLIMTPMVVHALASGTVSSLASSLGSIGIPGVMNLTAANVASKALTGGGRMYNTGLNAADYATRNTSPRTNQLVHKLPPLNVPPRKRVFSEWKTDATEVGPKARHNHSKVYGTSSPNSSQPLNQKGKKS
jgi:hypothetical protein